MKKIIFVNGKIKWFLKKCTYNIESIKDKNKLSQIIKKLLDKIEQNHSIEEILNYVFKENLILKKDNFKNFIESNGYYLWERLKKIPFKEYENSIKFQQENLPFATQHSVKGSEYDNVLVALDNGGWSHYNFKKYFLGTAKDTAHERTEKLLYVCVTRVKKNLVIYMELKEDEEKNLNKVKILFGDENVKNIKEINLINENESN